MKAGLHIRGAQLQTLDLGVLLEQQQQLEQSLSMVQKSNLKHWQGRLGDPIYAMYPRKRTREITPEEAAAGNKKFGQWVEEFTAWEVEDYRRLRSYEDPFSATIEYECLHLGVGVGLGLGYLKKAVLRANLKPIVCDWLVRALKYSQKPLQEILAGTHLDPAGVCMIGEARQVLTNIDESKVKFVQVFRVAEHMPVVDVIAAMEGGGRILRDPKAKFLIGGAFKGPENDKLIKTTANHYPLGLIRSSLERGAGRYVYEYHKDEFKDAADVLHTAVTFMAKP